MHGCAVPTIWPGTGACEMSWAVRFLGVGNASAVELGSAMASIGLTIPVVSLVSVFVGKSLVMGLDPEHMVLMVLTLFAGTLTLATGRTTVLQGGVHMVIFAAFLVIAAIP